MSDFKKEKNILTLMRMRDLIFFVALFIYFDANAQESFLFKMKYFPEHRYHSSIEMHNNIEINLKGSKEELDKLKAQGAESPMVMAGTTIADYTIQTGSTTAKTFPATIVYTSYFSKQLLNSKEILLPKNNLTGKEIFAHCDSNSMFHVDSISGKTANDSLFSLMSSLINRINKEIKFPEKKIKIGDSFTQNMPFNMPVLGGSMPSLVKTVYKLIYIKDEQGVFDIIQTAEVNMKIQQGDVNILATGTGKLFFSLKNQFPIKYAADMILKFTLNMSGVIAEGAGKITADYNTEIN